MQTELQAIASIRTQYRAAFRTMAFSGVRWSICRAITGDVILLSEIAESPSAQNIIVPNVHAMAEETAINALSAALRRAQ